MNYAYLATTLAVGALLYWRRPGLYIGFTWWLWFLTPEIRRLLDYAQGWNPINPVMLAPYLVSALTILTLVYHSPKLQLTRFFPFALIFLGVFYAYAVGVYRAGVLSPTYQLVEWLVPVAFAFYLVVHWRRYPVYAQAVQRTFMWGVLVIGVYGLIQFFFLPPWDRYWMVNVPLTSIGTPDPLEVRVFSTLNSPQPFGAVMMVGLLLLFSGGSVLRWFAVPVGYASFLLSLVRTAWGGWLVALLYVFTRRAGFRPYSLVTLVVTVLLALPLLFVGPAANTINTRLQTLTGLEQDNSFEARVEFYAEFVPQALSNQMGRGLGSTGVGTKLSAVGKDIGALGENAAFDSGVVEIPFILGWPGAMLYVGGLIWLLLYAFRNSNPQDVFAAVSRGILVAMLVMLLFEASTYGLPGMLFWTFLGLAIAGAVYHRQTLSGHKSEVAREDGPGGRSRPEDVAREGVARSRWARAPATPDGNR